MIASLLLAAQLFAEPAPSSPQPLKLQQGENRKVEAWLKAGGVNPQGDKLEVNSLHWSYKGQPWLPVMGEFHYARYPASGWEDQILKMKAAGIDIVSTYVFWVNSENPRGTWNWQGDQDLRRFLQLCAKHGLFVWLRPGPYINAEAKNGGLPDWANKNGRRSDAPWYLDEVKRYYGQVAKQTRGLYFKDGGPIIGLQVDNEFAHGDAKHLGTLLKLAQDLGMVAPFNSCTNNSKYDYPKGDLIPLQGAYPYRGWGGPTPSTDYLYSADAWNAMQNIGGLPYDGDRFPRGMAEMGVGCWQGYGQRFVVPPCDSEGHFQNVLGRGCNLIGYYMYQGGTQKAGTEGGGHPLTYDFQAPLGEYGQVRPSADRLRLLHHFVRDFGSELALMQPVRPENMVLDPRDNTHLRYCGRFAGQHGFLFLCNTQAWVDNKPIPQVQIKIESQQGSMLVPSQPFTLAADTCPILPVHLDLNGSDLIHAAAQPLARITVDGVPHLFFFAIEGLKPEFAFAAATQIEGLSFRRDGERQLVEPAPGQSFAVAAGSRRAVVTLLSRAQAEHSWRIKFRGQERLILSDSPLLVDGDQLELSGPKNSFAFSCFPALKEPLAGDFDGKTEGLFSRHRFQVPELAHGLSFAKLDEHSGKVELKPLPAGLKDAFLFVDYLGSTAEVWIDGRKYSDERFNGKIWDIGIKRFLADGQPHQLEIRVQKWDKGVHGIPADKQPKNPAEEAGILRGLSIVPEYQLRLR
ncbi:MAG: hypothetical protein RL095_3445 [Verrucomicrobiota bacterium]|jgi:hypothetical protein